ncbi:predicted protein [Nematostella vectensis]|uniref:Peptidase M12B domain-containing protein n=1 Tax=Nematostella vectensis TaxID=45351 RepID=A7SIV2_NEMVE|nr:predicted protein [Nematostella vectensis]|eukprot:XP_001628431.1 predicted protein [Nematostella vectensis]
MASINCYPFCHTIHLISAEEAYMSGTMTAFFIFFITAPSYYIVHPFHSDEYGNFVGYNLRPQEESRQRRSTGPEEPDFHYFKFRAMGKDLHLKVAKSDGLLSERARVHTVHKDGSKTSSAVPREAEYYSGHVTSHPDSMVALRSDSGLAGLISTPWDSLFIQPLPDHLAKYYGKDGGAQPHLIHRRSVDDVMYDYDTEKIVKHKFDKEEQKLSARPLAKRSGVKYLETHMIADSFITEKYGEETTNYLLMIAHVTRQVFLGGSVGDIKIHLVVVGITLNTGGFGYDSSASKVDRVSALTHWALTHLTVDDGDRAHADVLVLMSNTTGGIAVAGSTCNGLGRTLAGDIGIQSALLVAHEIAHSVTVALYSALKLTSHVHQMLLHLLMGRIVESESGALRASASMTVPCPLMEAGLTGQRTTLLVLILVTVAFNGKREPALIPRGFPYECNLFDLPPGATHAHVGKTEADITILGLKNTAGRFLISVPSWSKTIHAAGTRISYKKESYFYKDMLDIDGPTNARLGIYMVFPRICCAIAHLLVTIIDLENIISIDGVLECFRVLILLPPGLVRGSSQERDVACVRIDDDTYVRDSVCAGAKPMTRQDCETATCTASWYTTEWSPCSATCGRGTQSRSVICRRETFTGSKQYETLPDSSCTGSKPTVTLTQKCNKVNCPPEWVPSDWSACTKTCKGGQHSRTISCKQKDLNGVYQSLADFLCHHAIKPPLQQDCNRDVVCPKQLPVHTEVHYHWSTGIWSACLFDCGPGAQERHVSCIRSDDGTYVADSFCAEAKPASTQECEIAPCAASWYKTEWNPCSATCGKGSQSRSVVCRREIFAGSNQYKTLPDSSCTGSKPALSQKCENYDNCPAEWVATEWSACSQTCAGGQQTRTVTCKRKDLNSVYQSLSDSDCDQATKPTPQQECNSDVECSNFLGCYRDIDRPLPKLVANLRSNIDWHDMSKTIAECEKMVKAMHPTWTVFGIEFYGECWSGENGASTYAQDGKIECTKTNSYQGTGGSWVLAVYKVKGSK